MVLNDDKYRKPEIGMWGVMERILRKYYKINPLFQDSFYCGDAAGREASGNIKNDFADTDYKFAENIGIMHGEKLKFYTPEEFFADDETRQKKISHPITKLSVKSPEFQFKPINKQEMIILVGYPGCGKSRVAQQISQNPNYEIINRDSIGDMRKCYSAARTALTNGKSIVIDNTNLSKENRRQFLDIANTFKIVARCFYSTVDIDLAYHLNIFRVRKSGWQMKKIPMMVYYKMMKDYVKPSPSEGFIEVAQIPFVPKFTDEKERKLFTMYS